MSLVISLSISCPTLCNPMHGQQPASPLSVGFFRQECWSGLPFPSPGILLIQGSNPGLLHYRWSLALQADSLPTEPPGKPRDRLKKKKKKDFHTLLFLKNNQFKVILMGNTYIWGWQILLPYNSKKSLVQHMPVITQVKCKVKFKTAEKLNSQNNRGHLNIKTCLKYKSTKLVMLEQFL